MTKVLCSCLTQVLVLLKKQTKIGSTNRYEFLHLLVLSANSVIPQKYLLVMCSAAVVLRIGHRNTNHL